MFEIEWESYAKMLEHAYIRAPEEVCGLLIEGGREQDKEPCDRCRDLVDVNRDRQPRRGWHWVSCGRHPLWYLPCHNVATIREHEFCVDPQDQINAWNDFGNRWRTDRWGGVRGIFHSHPRTDGRLSEVDIDTLLLAALMWGGTTSAPGIEPIFPVLAMGGGVPVLHGWTLANGVPVSVQYRVV